MLEFLQPPWVRRMMKLPQVHLAQAHQISRLTQELTQAIQDGLVPDSPAHAEAVSLSEYLDGNREHPRRENLIPPPRRLEPGPRLHPAGRRHARLRERLPDRPPAPGRVRRPPACLPARPGDRPGGVAKRPRTPPRQARAGKNPGNPAGATVKRSAYRWGMPTFSNPGRLDKTRWRGSTGKWTASHTRRRVDEGLPEMRSRKSGWGRGRGAAASHGAADGDAPPRVLEEAE